MPISTTKKVEADAISWMVSQLGCMPFIGKADFPGLAIFFGHRLTHFFCVQSVNEMQGGGQNVCPFP